MSFRTTLLCFIICLAELVSSIAFPQDLTETSSVTTSTGGLSKTLSATSARIAAKASDSSTAMPTETSKSKTPLEESNASATTVGLGIVVPLCAVAVTAAAVALRIYRNRQHRVQRTTDNKRPV